ncbi:S-norcoclaurine synthase 1-like [Iris pallida]|uniref:S-norcoclaurine synthase 1-like n=1 Tax=Iris pallida TaxID=29817 RepID=A0AAX6EK36_IRIPA|nr:S-norcoclaurine synthase 1-like [Iris pallida]
MEVAENGGPKLKLLGRSLPVDNVQALAASGDPGEIPQRYIRPEVMSDVDSAGADDIPIVDLGRLADLVSSAGEAAKLKMVLPELKLVHELINHGVAEEVMQSMKVDIEEFFQQPLEEKEAVAQPPGSIEGYGQAFVVSEDQKLDWGDMYFLGTRPVTFRNMGLWATHPPTFRSTLDKYSQELKKVTDRLLGAMAKNLGMQPEKFLDLFKNGVQSVRMNYYPPCPHHADKVLGLSPHSDAVGLTLLLQVNQVQGLQIRRNGRDCNQTDRRGFHSQRR